MQSSGELLQTTNTVTFKCLDEQDFQGHRVQNVSKMPNSSDTDTHLSVSKPSCTNLKMKYLNIILNKTACWDPPVPFNSCATLHKTTAPRDSCHDGLLPTSIWWDTEAIYILIWYLIIEGSVTMTTTYEAVLTNTVY